MRKYLLLVLLLYGMLATSIADNRCLLIGISHYPSNSGWPTISSVNDVELLKKQLRGIFTIDVLLDEEAKHDDIVKAIQHLTNTAHSGDTILIHFSCHGQQMLTSDKDEVDCLDEALVPYDAMSKKSASYSGEKHLRDNEFGDLITQLRKAVGKGGLVVVTLDACYSDSMDKGGNAKDDSSPIYRGGMEVFGSNYISADSLNNIKQAREVVDTVRISPMLVGADVVMLSACKSNQKNMEIVRDSIGYGSLSYAMFQSFNDNDFTNIEEWIDGVFKHMVEYGLRQEPQIRTTLLFEGSPTATRTTTKGEEASEIQEEHCSFLPILIVSFIILILILLIGVIKWRKRKI